jgi:hypothetical protein
LRIAQDRRFILPDITAEHDVTREARAEVTQMGPLAALA